VFGLTPGGLYIVDASHGQAMPPAVVPLFWGIPSTQANPNVGPVGGGTQVQFVPAPLGAGSADGIANSMEAYFGTVPAKNDVVGPYPSSSYASNDYPEQPVPVPVPPGTPGWADVVLTTSNGTDTLKRGMEYLKKEAQVTGGRYEFAAYDAVRDVFYLTGGGNNVAVFNPNAQAFGPPLQSTCISSVAVLQELVLTPDNSKLL